uniref:Uncharacterized protein n=1 Tax=Janibacter limosus TaxID=53458 RepID=A0AC61U1G2_9MICO|nr:hypothetical protein [Janibacter limosus]
MRSLPSLALTATIGAAGLAPGPRGLGRPPRRLRRLPRHPDRGGRQPPRRRCRWADL